METPVPDLCALSYVGLLPGTVDVIQENDNGGICTIISPGNCFCISPMITCHAILGQSIEKRLKNDLNKKNQKNQFGFLYFNFFIDHLISIK